MISEDYFDAEGRYVNHPRFGYAKGVIEYDDKGKKIKKYTAEDLK